MTPFVEVSFRDGRRVAAIESSIHRWVARLEATRIEMRRVAVTVEPVGRKRTGISVTMTLGTGRAVIAATSHEEVYVAVSDAFRAIRQQLLGRSVPPRLAFA